ncbi:DinB family protein [Bacillus sp. EB01]|uniref:DinB family protein n=1 Tax=Bacillus sp. EB01 TaxID=1347086 RepID=UPI0005C747D7|nr:DinB family protein [Bacillus sp. EB01]
MSTPTLTSSIASIHQSLDELVSRVKDLPEDLLRWNPSQEEWSIMQILCHVEEAVQYWLDEVERLLVSPGSEWGRGLQDEKRLEAVGQEKVAGTSREKILNALVELKPRVAETLNKLNDETLAQEAPSRNPRFGVKPLSFIVDHLLVDHSAKHLRQVERNISKANL